MYLMLHNYTVQLKLTSYYSLNAKCKLEQVQEGFIPELSWHHCYPLHHTLAPINMSKREMYQNALLFSVNLNCQ